MLVFIVILVSRVLRNKRGFGNGRKLKITGAIRKFLKKHFSSQDVFWGEVSPRNARITKACQAVG